jgi:hypothetical protein
VLESPGPVVSSGRLIKGADGRPIPDHRVILEGVRVLVAIDERRAKLCGLDAPRRQAVSVITEDDLDREIARLGADLERREAKLRPAIDAGPS